MATFLDAFRLKQQVSSAMLKRKGIVGVGVGYLNRKNPKQGAALVVYKKKSAILNFPKMMQLSLNGSLVKVPTRIVGSGAFSLHHNARRAVLPKRFEGTIPPEELQKKVRPVPPGYSVGTTYGSGTVGLIMRDANSQQLFVASNNHVLNPENTNVAIETIQPGGADGGTATVDRIGQLYAYVPYNFGGDNFLDAATSIPDNNNLLSPEYPTVGVVPGYVDSYSVGDRFYKVSRTTADTFGVVDAIGVDAKISTETGELLFRNQTVVASENNQPIALPGDSGGVFLRASDDYAAAMLYAGPEDGLYAICFPIVWFLQVFNTVIAGSNGASGRLKKVKTNGSFKFVCPLTKVQLKKIKIRKARRR